MESGVFVVVIGLTLWAYVADRLVLTGVLLGLLVLARPDGALFAIVLGVHHFLRWRRLPWSAVVAGQQRRPGQGRQRAERPDEGVRRRGQRRNLDWVSELVGTKR